jgi:acyl-CoA thioesterase-1
MVTTSNFINYLMNKTYAFINVISLIAIIGCNNNQQNTSAKQPPDKNIPVVSVAKVKTILFFGNSLTAGYGVDPSEAFHAFIQNKID